MAPSAQNCIWCSCKESLDDKITPKGLSMKVHWVAVMSSSLGLNLNPFLSHNVSCINYRGDESRTKRCLPMACLHSSRARAQVVTKMGECSYICVSNDIARQMIIVHCEPGNIPPHFWVKETFSFTVTSGEHVALRLVFEMSCREKDLMLWENVSPLVSVIKCCFVPISQLCFSSA